MVEEAVEDFMESLRGFHAADGVLEIRVDAVADVNQSLFHALDMERGVKTRGLSGQFLGKLDDIGQQLLVGGYGSGRLLKRSGNLREKPGISDGSPTHHKAGRTGMPVVIEGGLGVDHVAVGNDRAGQGFDGQFYPIGTDGCLIPVGHRAAVDRQTVDRMLAEGFK